MSGTPTKPEIERYLVEQKAPRKWVEFLHGLPWKYLRPVVTIAKNSKAHPAAALGTAVAYSSDETFKATARQHLERKAALVDSR